MHSDLSLARGHDQAALGAARLEYMNKHLRDQLDAIRRRLQRELDHAARGERC